MLWAQTPGCIHNLALSSMHVLLSGSKDTVSPTNMADFGAISLHYYYGLLHSICQLHLVSYLSKCDIGSGRMASPYPAGFYLRIAQALLGTPFVLPVHEVDVGYALILGRHCALMVEITADYQALFIKVQTFFKSIFLQP